MIEDIAEEGRSLLTALRQMHPSLGLSVTDEWGYFIARGDLTPSTDIYTWLRLDWISFSPKHHGLLKVILASIDIAIYNVHVSE